MTDNIISFPFHRKNIPVTEELLRQWREGLHSSSYEEQWRTFEHMTSFSDIYVIQLVQEFLILPTGEPYLKTKMVHALKSASPPTLPVQIEKYGQSKQISLGDVPIQWEEWPDELREPVNILQDKAFADPSLVEMGKELWKYFLEKEFPFYPQINNGLIWAAGLHFYTLTAMNEEQAKIHIVEKLPKLYQLSQEDILRQNQRFEALLKHS